MKHRIKVVALVGLVVLLPDPTLLGSTAAVAAPQPQADGPGSSSWCFEILSRAFQANPFVDVTVITEMTTEGREKRRTSPGSPVYFAAHNTPMKERGWSFGDDNPPPPATIEQAMQRALAVNGFLPADARHAPSLLLFYHWGMLNQPAPGNPADSVNRYLVDRATVAGGETFAAEYGRALTEQREYDNTRTVVPMLNPFRYRMACGEPTKTGGPVMPTVAPMQLFAGRNQATENLVEQAQTELYFAILSAYDYASAARGQRQLLWRTKITADKRGAVMAIALPAAIAASASYLGHEQSGAVALKVRALRDVGLMQVVEQPADLPPDAPRQSR